MRFLIHLNGVEVGAVTWEALGRTLTSTPKILLASVQVALLSLAYLTPPFLFSLSTTPSQPQPAFFTVGLCRGLCSRLAAAQWRRPSPCSCLFSSH